MSFRIMLSLGGRKVLNYLSKRGRAGEFKPIPAHFHELPCRIPIGVREARY